MAATARRSNTLPLPTSSPQLTDVEGWATIRRKFFSKPRRHYLRLNGAVISVHNHQGSAPENEISILNCSLSYSLRRASLLITQSTGHRYYIVLEDRQSFSIWIRAIQLSSKRSFHELYHTKEKIGEGAFATVHRAVHIESGKVVAVKQIKKKQFDLQMSKELNREMYAVRFLKHPSILLSHDIFNTQSHVYIVMDYLQGGTLKDNIQKIGGRISEQLAIPIIHQIIQACDYLHTIGFVHRDIKLENILCDKNDLNDVKIQLGDFGYVNFVESIRHSCLRSLVGTPVYVAPEIINRHEYGCGVDIYAVGIMIYRMLSGHYPYDGKDDDERTMSLAVEGRLKFPSQLWSHVSNDCKNFVKALLQPRPEKRLTAKAALQHPWLTKKISDDYDIKSDHIAALEQFKKSDSSMISPITSVPRNSMQTTTNRHRLSKAIRGIFMKRFSLDLGFNDDGVIPNTNDEISSISHYEEEINEDNNVHRMITNMKSREEKRIKLKNLRRVALAAVFVGKLVLISGVKHVSPRKPYHTQLNENDDDSDEDEVVSFRQRVSFTIANRMGGLRSIHHGLGFGNALTQVGDRLKRTISTNREQ